MTSGSSESTRRKHHRPSSTENGEEHSKRRKHRSHRRHHRRHRSGKDKEEATEILTERLESPRIDETEVGARKLENNGEGEGGSLGQALVSGEAVLDGVDYEMEEGEILEDHGLVDRVSEESEKSKKGLDMDIELGEIDTNGYDDSDMVVNEENVERVGKRKLVKESVDGKESLEMDQERFSNPMKYSEESYRISLLKSPESSRGRSRSRSIVREASVEDPYFSGRKLPHEFDDEMVVAPDNSYRQNIDGVKEKKRERSSTRYTRRVEKHYGGETRDIHRKDSRERSQNRDISREKDREEEIVRERERNRHRERYREERDRERQRGREWDREREERNRDRDRGREGFRDATRARSREGRDYESEELRRRRKYGRDEDGYTERENYSRHGRDSDDYRRERSRRSDLENVSSKDKQDENSKENLEREDEIQEDYQDKIVMQLAEQEEDDLERIKEESRRRRQAILEKYKNQHQHGTPTQDMVKDQVEESSAHVESVEAISKQPDSQVESADIYPEPSFTVEKSPSRNGLSDIQLPTGTGGLGEGSPKSERSDDMFCDDIFGDSPVGVRKASKGGDVAVVKSGLNDNWDDADGYYGYRFGEILDGRYEIIAAHGKGVFSTVVRAKDLKAKPGDPEEVAIKIIRNNETMYKAGMEELVILKKLVGTDPDNRRHCVRFLSTFKYRNHLCLVFESLHMNLREVNKKFGRNIGLSLLAVRAYAKQLFIALKHLKNCGVLHCDIKPDNMLVSEAKNVLKLCDFGNAMFAGKNEITPYLVSRFYRAPEIILGLTYDHPMDIWSVGCCLFEICTGKVLFPGATNNDMLRLHMELKGPFPKKMLRKGLFIDQHFDQDLNFLATEEDPVSKKAIRRLVVNIKPKDFGTLISVSKGEDPKMVANFKDLLEKIFVLDPDKRLNVSQALSHPFITGK